MCWNTFGRSAIFAALAGLGVIPWLVMAGPLLGMRQALALYLVALTATYVAGFAPSLQRGLGAGMVVAVLGGCLALTTRTLPELAFGLAVLLATARIAFVYQLRPARAVGLEVALVGGGLLFARVLAGPSLVSMMLAVWGFLLVQSFFFLVGGVCVRERTVPQKDAFDTAHNGACALLDRLTV